MENPNDPTKPQRPPSSADRVAAAERDRDEAIRELETIRSMRIVRLGLAVSETVSERDLRGLPTRVSTALRREDAALQPTASDDATGTGDPASLAMIDSHRRTDMAPYAHVRLLHHGASTPLIAPATEVANGDHVDLVVRSPGADVSDSIVEDESDGASAIPIVAYVPHESAMNLGVDADLVVSEDPDVATVARERFGANRVLLIDPSVDIHRNNPAGFERTPSARICVFVERLSRDADTIADLAQAHPALDVVVEPGTTLPGDRQAEEVPRAEWADHAQHYAIVAADPSLHQTDVSFVEHVLAISACGTPVTTEPDERLHHLLPGMTINPADEHALTTITNNPLERERFSVAARRHVVREHNRRRRFEAVLDAVGIPLRSPPLVSVLLSTRRPDRVEAAFANIGLQRYPKVEVVAVLHG